MDCGKSGILDEKLEPQDVEAKRGGSAIKPASEQRYGLEIMRKSKAGSDNLRNWPSIED